MANKTLLSILGFSLLSCNIVNAEELTLKQKVEAIIEGIKTDTSLLDSVNFNYNGKAVILCIDKHKETNGFYLKFPNHIENEVHFVIRDISGNGYGSVDLIGIVKCVDINVMYRQNLKIPNQEQMEKANNLYSKIVDVYYQHLIDSKKLEEKKINNALKKLLDE